MKFQRYVATCYPKFKSLGSVIANLPLSARSLLIKSCQAQTVFLRDDDTPLATLILQHPDVEILRPGYSQTIPLIDFFPIMEVSLNNSLDAMIILDLLRCAPLDDVQVKLAKEKGWATEIRLAESPGFPSCNFFPFFFDLDNQICHNSLPHNLSHLWSIRSRFKRFKAQMIESRPVFYPRANSKSMSRSTRRNFEENFCTQIPDGIEFCQDDWERVYHETGFQVPGLVEMRQKWYPAQAKPRTYFAMGGTCYSKSRFLQDFFTQLVNLFPATNHITRLRPERLRISVTAPDNHYRIYDLSSFTSNMVEQRNFLLALKEFYRGVMVVVVDELFGPMETDLGDLLDEYYESCVEHPELSYERSIFDDLNTTESRKHARASLLGIFGNLMTCTIAHYLLVSCTVTCEDEINIAGDDGLILETLLNKYLLDAAISLVGECAPDKTMRSNQIGAVCLKRPISELPPSLILGTNVVPPNLAVTLCYLLGEPCDPRFEIFGLEELTLEERIGVLGKDLLRFLESCFDRGVTAEEASEVYRGFQSLVQTILGVFPQPGSLAGLGYIWPFDPMSYNFYHVSPLVIYAHTCCTALEFHVREVVTYDVHRLQYAGDVIRGNSCRRLALLERLGYIEKKPIVMSLSGMSAVHMWISLQKASNLAPDVYDITCLADIPVQFVYDDTEL